MSFICGFNRGAPPDALRVLTELLGCCIDAQQGDPSGCTCWEPVYNLDQADPQPGEPVTRSHMCDDCAYRPDSPERQGDDNYAANPSTADVPFWCHQGMRKPVAYRHPAGITIDARHDHYAPPILTGVPYKADGAPGDRCAGWAAHHRHEGDLVTTVLTEIAEAATP